ncbi:MAG: YebC/PmpR family DNA-binding transcriptional regulator [Candidatus Kerfeldbacteria bacterium]|nr:YebC/PmpR family DNA-binding transcriptional regulator [Candidatus Kerfeldbacteria bacterium]
MSGHSKWATIKRQKAVTDAKKSASFTKLAKNISVAARNGKDPNMNSALRVAIEKAREGNMPKDNIERAVLKGAGELPGVTYEEITYEGYAPGGVAVMIECVTDNTNRTVQNLRAIFSDHGGALGSAGSVKFLFDYTGVIRVPFEDQKKSIEDIELLAIDAGASDIRAEEEGMTILVSKEQLPTCVSALQKEGVTIVESGVEWVAKTLTAVEESARESFEACIAEVEEHDDVNRVFTAAA